jgi:hypothetical protein
MSGDPIAEFYEKIAISKAVYKLELEIAQLKFELKEIRKHINLKGTSKHE